MPPVAINQRCFFRNDGFLDSFLKLSFAISSRVCFQFLFTRVFFYGILFSNMDLGVEVDLVRVCFPLHFEVLDGVPTIRDLGHLRRGAWCVLLFLNLVVIFKLGLVVSSVCIAFKRYSSTLLVL